MRPTGGRMRLKTVRARSGGFGCLARAVLLRLSAEVEAKHSARDTDDRREQTRYQELSSCSRPFHNDCHDDRNGESRQQKENQIGKPGPDLLALELDHVTNGE